MVLFFEIKLELKVKFLDDIKVCMHDSVVRNIKMLLLALVQKIWFLFVEIDVFYELRDEFPVFLLNGKEKL